MNIDTMVTSYAATALWSTHNELHDSSPCMYCGRRVVQVRNSKGTDWRDWETQSDADCPQAADGGGHEVLNPEGHSEMLDGDYDVDDIADETMEAMREDCVSFLRAAEEEYGEALERADIEAGQFGHDFWLTRHHHGAGFWDRGLGKLGDDLTKLAHPYGDFNLYVDLAGITKIRHN